MNAFLSAQQVETEAYRRLTPLLAHWSENGQFVFTDKGPASRLLQEVIGDIAMNVRGGEVHSIELKAEAEASCNIFAEEWSNYPPNEDAAPNPGWARKTNATYLWQYFLDNDELWIFRRRAFQEVLYGRLVAHAGYADTIEGGLIYDPSYGIKQKVQSKREQKNITTGFCVPISLITARIAHKHIVVADYLREIETPPLSLVG
jgi:hypothetical protein